MARSAVDEAMKNILLPQIEKEKLVEQLQGLGHTNALAKSI